MERSDVYGVYGDFDMKYSSLEWKGRSLLGAAAYNESFRFFPFLD